MGVVHDKYGLLVVNIFSSLIMCTGLILMIFVEDVELFLWGAWPCITIAGVCNHLGNTKMAIAIPTFKGTIMACLSGCFGAGGSVGLIMKKIMDDFGVQISDIFLYWLILFLILSTMKILLWTPVKIPLVGIENDDDYSLFSNSAILIKFKGCIRFFYDFIYCIY